jgi:hypothetical protein
MGTFERRLEAAEIASEEVGARSLTDEQLLELLAQAAEQRAEETKAWEPSNEG